MRFLWYLLVTSMAATAVTLTLWFTAHSGGYDPPETPEIGLEELQLPTYPRRSAPLVVGDRNGVMALDTVHFNNFLGGELESLLSKVSNLGYEVDFFGDRLAVGLRGDFERARVLEEGLRGADSMLIVAPILPYTAEEASVVRRFVEKGGKVVLAGDPTRVNRINELATAIGLNFESDFLYNVVEHHANYRNVIFRDFAPHAVTQGLSEIVLYTAGSISGSGEPLVWGDGNTQSSLREAAGRLSPVVLAMDGRVVAMADSTFIEAPYDRVLDNDQLLSNLADFLTTSERVFDLEDFPALLAEDVVVTATSPTVIAVATQLTNFLSSGDRRVPVETLARPTVDTVFVGLYDDRAEVGHHLQAAQVSFEAGRIESPAAPSLSATGSGLVLLDTRGGRNVVVVLASSPFELSFLVQSLTSGAFRSGLVSPNLGLYEF